MPPPGWDGDDLAGQMEDNNDRAQAAREQEQLSNLSPAERQLAARRESLRLSQARVANQLSRATNHAYRKMLEGALAALDAEMKELDEAK